MAAAPRWLFLHTFALDTPHNGGYQRALLLRRHLADAGEVTAHEVKRWKARPAPGFYDDTRRPIDAGMAAALVGDLCRHRPGRKARERFAELRPEQYDAVVVFGPGCAFWTGFSDPRRGILDLCDLPSDIYASNARAATPPGLLRSLALRRRIGRVRRSERRMADAFRFVSVCSGDERRAFGRSNAAVVPNAFWPQPAFEREPAPPGRTLVFVGTLGWAPNRRGIEWFVREVWPRIRAQRPDLVLRVVGGPLAEDETAALPAWSRAPGVEALGRVPDVTPFLEDALYSVCPILDGGGTRIKIVESLAFGRPVVATPFGARGLALGEPEGVLRREGAADFAEACLALAASPERCRALGLAGRKAALERHSPEVQRRALHALLETILREREESR
jgi:glycosyltransferase involved in cell wall biosynthesis